MIRSFGTLGVQETVRLTKHPLGVAGVLGSVVWSANPALRDSALLRYSPGTSFSVYNSLTVLPTLLLGPTVLFAANLLTSRERRAGTTEILASTPVRTRARTVGLLAAAFGPAILTAVMVAAQVTAFHTFGPRPSRWPTVDELATRPVMVLRAGLLGVMIGRWLPFPGSAAVAVVTLGFLNTIAGNLGQDTWLSFVPWRDLVTTDEQGRIIGYFPGSVRWRVAYLLCLDAMAAIGALPKTPGPKRALFACGLVAAAMAAFTRWSQLP